VVKATGEPALRKTGADMPWTSPAPPKKTCRPVSPYLFSKVTTIVDVRLITRGRLLFDVPVDAVGSRFGGRVDIALLDIRRLVQKAALEDEAEAGSRFGRGRAG
jgi:hypothetical protein